MRFFCVILLLCLAGCQRPDRGEKIGEKPLGYRGEARLNPYLAAERYLKEKGFAAASSRTWAKYDWETSVIFMPVSFLQTKGMGMRVLSWVEGGGMLVLTVEGGERERNDFRALSPGSGLPEEGDFTGMDYLFEELGIELVESDWSDLSVEGLEPDGHLERPWHLSKISDEWGLGSFQLEQEGPVGLRGGYGWSWDFEVDGVSRVVGVTYGAGEVMVMAHARPLRSPYLAQADHAEFLEAIAQQHGGDGDIVFLYGSGISFFGLLWKEGWMVIVAGLVLLLAWLWKRIPRFGPVLHDSFIKPKPYGDSLVASARFLWRKGQIEHLLRPLWARLGREYEGDPETLGERLAESSDLSRQEVAEVLTIQPNKDPGHLLKVVQKLQSLLKR